MGKFKIVENALIIPASKASGGLGVLDQHGKFIEESTIWRSDAPLYERPNALKPKAHVEGTHLYGGIMSWHFGHFLVESLSRLWPVNNPPEPIQSVLFVPKGEAARKRKEAKFQSEMLDLMIPGLDRQVLTQPTIVERLIVPEQGFGNGALEAGTEAFREFVQNRNWPEPYENSPKRLYVTRAGLNRSKKGRILGDLGLEKCLKRNGFHSVRPEKLTLAEQIRLYRGAKRILFDDGSAVHLFGLVAQAQQTTASIQRRVFHSEHAVGQRQLRAFAGLDLKVFDAVVREWRPAQIDRATSKSHGELDQVHLFEALKGFGAVGSEDKISDMGLPTPKAVAKDMAKIGYVPVERSKPLPEPPAIARFWGVQIPAASHLDNRKLRSLRDGFYERQEVLSAMARFSANDRVLELGAGAGIVGSAVALNCGIEALLSFEANADMVPAARALYARNGLQKIAKVQRGIVVTDPAAPKTLPFAINEGYLGSKVVEDGQVPEASMRIDQVPTVQLSKVIEDFKPTALLMDIEGSELHLLETGDLSSFEKIVVELHRGIYGREGMRRCRAALKKSGLRQDSDWCRRGVETWLRA